MSLKDQKNGKNMFFLPCNCNGQWNVFDSFGFGFAFWYRRSHENHSNPHNSHSNSSNTGLKDNATLAQSYVLPVDTPFMSCRCFDCRLTGIVGFSVLVQSNYPNQQSYCSDSLVLGLIDGAASFWAKSLFRFTMEQIYQSYGKNDSLALPDPFPKAIS